MSSVTGDGLPIMCFAKLRACFFGPLISCHESWGDWSLSVSLTVKWVSTLSCHKWVLEGLSGWSGILDLLIILLLRPAGRHLSESPPHSLTKFISVPSPLLHQLSKEGVLLDGHHWNLLAHHPEGRQANTFICHSKTVLSCCWPLDASRNVMKRAGRKVQWPAWHQQTNSEMRISLEALSSLSISKGCCRWAPSKMLLGANWKASNQSKQWNLWLVTSWDGTWSIFKQEKKEWRPGHKLSQ